MRQWYFYVLMVYRNEPVDRPQHTAFHDVSHARNLWACFV